MTISGNQGFYVPIIPPDLRREETFLQISDAPNYLDKVSKEVYARIGKIVEENKAHLQKINDRVKLAAAKVDKLKGSNKATKVFASAKYPAEDSPTPFRTTFSNTDGVREIKHSHFKAQEKHAQVDERILREKLQFYNVHLNTRARKDAMQAIRCGYKDKDIEEEVKAMAEAPSTIVRNEEMFRVTAENYLYMSEIGTVPEIAVPDLLPNLPGVADDLAFSGDQGPSIAPSVMSSNIPELDAVPTGPTTNASQPPPPPPPGPAADMAPPPPPPPPSSGPPPPPPDAPPPPPPGMPPPPPQNVPKEITQPSSGRQSLLKAGGAAGAGLKSHKDRKHINEKKKQEEKEQNSAGASKGGGGGDLMSDLFSRISMRRKGISGIAKPGAGEKTETTPNLGAMEKISSMIPAPPKNNAPKQDVGSDDDWE